MIGKLFLLSVLLVGFASAQNIEEFMLRLNAEIRAFNDVDPCSDRTDAHFASNSRGCAWYHECNTEGVAVNQGRCPTGYWFNYEDQVCDYEENVECTFDDAGIPTECPAVGISIIPNIYSCSSYTVCFDGIEIDRECPEGLHFSYYDNDCVTEHLADCNLDNYLCAEAIATGNTLLVPHTRDCTSYFVCVGSTPVAMSCRPDDHFSVVNGYCDDPDDAGCVPANSEEETALPDDVFYDCEGQSGVTVPHPTSCTFFYFCANGRSYLQNCGSGLVFDINTNRCSEQLEDGVVNCILDVDAESVADLEAAPEVSGQNFVRRLSNL